MDTIAACDRHRRQRERNGDGKQRRHHRQHRDPGKSVSRLNPEAERRAEPERSIHRDALPRHHLAGARGADAADAPAHGAGDVQALGNAQQHPADNQNREPDLRRSRQQRRGEIATGRKRGERQPAQHDPARPVMVAQRSGVVARQHGDDGLDADHPADGEAAEAELLVHVERQRRQRCADHEDAAKDDGHQRRQPRDGAALRCELSMGRNVIHDNTPENPAGQMPSRHGMWRVA